jgi:hypothetical protein
MQAITWSPDHQTSLGSLNMKSEILWTPWLQSYLFSHTRTGIVWE